MKAERRHELRENDLIHALEAARDYLNENGGRLAVAVIGVLAIVVAVSFGLRSRAAAYEDLWRQKNSLRFEDVEGGRKSLEQLAVLTNRSSDESFVISGLIEQGRQGLRLATMVEAPPDRELNDRAREAFEELRRRFPNNPMAQGVAGLGLATVEENSYALDHDAARKAKAETLLRSIVENPALAGMPFPQMAGDRLQALDEVFTEVITVPAPAVPETADPAADAPVGTAPVEVVPVEVPPAEGTPEGNPPGDTPPPGTPPPNAP